MSALPPFPAMMQRPIIPNHRQFVEERVLPSPVTRNEARNKKHSLDITQKLEQKIAQLNASGNIFKRWLYEIISWVISALSMGAIVGIALYLGNQSLTSWPLGLTILTVLSKIASAALILPTSEALGQLKWNWFNGKNSKEIWDFEIFDKASRGAWGSVMLLLRTKGRSLAALGAILTLLLIANDTFFQQVVDLPERWTLAGISSIAKVRWYEPSKDGTLEIRGGVEITQVDDNLWPKAQKFLYDNGTQPIPFGNGTSPELPLQCPTSNCTWPVYETLGFCSKCVELDVKQYLTFTCRTARVDWIANLSRAFAEDLYPNGTVCGWFFNATSELPTLMSGYTTTAVESSQGKGPAGEALLMRILPLVSAPWRIPLFGGSINFQDIRNPVADVVIAASNDGAASVYRNETPVMQECVLYWCVQQIRSTYQWAAYHEEIISSVTNTTPGPHPWITKKVNSEAFNGTDVTYIEDVIIRPSPSNESAPSYGVTNMTQIRVYGLFDDAFPSFVNVDNLTAKPSFRYKVGQSTTESFPRFRNVKFDPWMPPNNVSRHMERMAIALTNMLRSSSSNEMMTGLAFTVDTYIRIQWEWLIFPFSLLILSLVFLVATIIKTSKGAGETGPGVWKTSAMPTLIYSLPSEMQKQLTSSSKRGGQPSDDARSLRIRLHPKEGWRVSDHPSSPDISVAPNRPNQPPLGWI